MSKVLVLSEKALFYKADLNRDLAAIKIAQTCFGLGFDLAFDGLEIEVNACVGALQTPCLGGVQDLLFIALARLNPAERAQLPDVGDPFVGSNLADIWLDLGFDEIGAIVQAWLDLAEEVIVEVHHPNIKETLLTTALTQFYEIREQQGLKKKPSTSEVLDWLKLLLAEDMDAADLKKDGAFALPKLHGALLKNEQDVHLFERLAFMARAKR